MRSKRREWKKRRKRKDRSRELALACLCAAALMAAAGGIWLALGADDARAVSAVWAENPAGEEKQDGSAGTDAAAGDPGDDTMDGALGDGTLSGALSGGGTPGTSAGASEAKAPGAAGAGGPAASAEASGTAGATGMPSGTESSEMFAGASGTLSGTEGSGTLSGIQGQGASAGAPGTSAGPSGELSGTPGQGASAGTPGMVAGISGAGAAGQTALPGTENVPAQGSLLAQGQAFRVDRPKVKGIYVTGAMAGTANMDRLIDLVDRTELNALVIDVKNDEGYVVCDMDVPLVSEVGSVRRYVKDMPALIQKCKEKGIYLIARIVTFKDPILAEAKPEWSLHNADGTIFRDKSGLAWVNPYEEQVWEYLLQVAEGAVALGFDEIQFDYVRFSTDRGMKQVDFGGKAALQSREEAIETFIAYVTGPLHQLGAAVSADVYGVVIDSRTDQQIVGQNYVDLAAHLDYLSPMVYPSHYGPYNYNIPVPDAQPYDTVLAAMQASRLVLAGLDPKQKGTPEEASSGGTGTVTAGTAASGDGAVTVGAAAGADGTAAGAAGGGNGAAAGMEASADGTAASETAADGTAGTTANGAGAAATNAAPAVPVVRSAAEIAALAPMDTVRASVRPWLQDFTATWVKGHIPYGPEQLRAQIQAVYDAGYEEWILWNASNRYTEGGLLPETQE